MQRISNYMMFLLIVLAWHGAKAQQDPMYSMYMYDKMLINPAFTGSSNWLVGTIKYRNQFMGITGHPTTQAFNLHSPVQRKNIGIGMKVINDQTAISSNLNASAFLSYHLNFAGGKLSFGLEGGVYNRRINYQKLILSDLNDNVLPATSYSSLVPDAAYGVYYQKRQFYMGFSQDHVIHTSFNFHEPGPSDSHLYSHLYFMMGRVFDLSKSWSLEPSMLLKYQAASPMQFDLNTTLYYKDRVGLGVQYRTGDAFVSILRINITESLRIAYSYDLTLSHLSRYSRGAHEIMISYGFKLPPPPSQKEIHPRYYF